MRKLILLLTISIFASCSQNDDSTISEENIFASWGNLQTISKDQVETDRNANLVIRQELIFKENGTFDWLFSIVDLESEENFGYIMRQTGNFQLDENLLILQFDRYHSEQNAGSDKYNPSPLSNLILVDENVTAEYSIVLNHKNNTLLFDFPDCNNQSTTCPADIEFTKI